MNYQELPSYIAKLQKNFIHQHLFCNENPVGPILNTYGNDDDQKMGKYEYG